MEHRFEVRFEDDVLVSTGFSPEEFEEHAKFLLAAMLYQTGKLSSGQAARLCGRSRPGFLTSLAAERIPASNLKPSDVLDDLEFIRQHAG